MIQSKVFEVVVSGTHSIVIPNEIASGFYDAGHKRIKVHASFQTKTIEFYAALNRWKDNSFSIMFSKNKQKELDILPNDYFQLQFFEDTSKYGVEVPEEFEAVMLSDYDAYQIFESLTKGKQRGLIYMINRFKSSQKRIDKTLILCENLKRGIRDNKEILKPL
ncbi:YdeI/OmpD-associated family protein [Croceivirga thetidis]|uniref:YdeI/OmpD-associated family protein n=1 Tax=Croceivirga thetidis TaxID=2721623 RepID=A0ABX1GS09_9FLAO|nr:YdeI/OmpD-associated family protein [Croceivirga thetidis]NKI32716.1 YdeI/OmpD-associated family protein [Croceivirga thetidis]